jgi:hypothetical protein
VHPKLGGATNLKDFLPDGIKLLAITQNDDPGTQGWLANLAKALSPNGVIWEVKVPAPHHDLNGWLQAGATKEELEAGIKSATRYDTASPSSSPEPNRPLKGASILDYAEREIDMSRSLIANRWLPRHRGAFVIAPSGHGKSSFTIQTTICWSCGRVAFGLKPNLPWRILIIQAEDDDNDVIEMAQMCNRLGLTAAEKNLVRQNTHIELVDDVSGASFFPALDDLLTQWPADMVIINPYLLTRGRADQR